MNPSTPLPRRALVTGGSGDLGGAICRQLAADGLHVIVHANANVARAREVAEAIAADGGSAEAVAFDVADAAAADAALQALLEAGPVHALVNNAGGALGLDPVATGSIADWRTMYEVNVLGSLRVTQALLPALRAGGRGDVVLLTSTAGHDTYPGGGGYVAAKHAERTIAQTLRVELVGEPVRVIEIAPGMVATEEFSLVRFRGDAERAAATYAGVDAPLTAEDVADAIVWCLTRPHHVNIDSMVIRPRAQASNTLVARTAAP